MKLNKHEERLIRDYRLTNRQNWNLLINHIRRKIQSETHTQAEFSALRATARRARRCRAGGVDYQECDPYSWNWYEQG